MNMRTNDENNLKDWVVRHPDTPLPFHPLLSVRTVVLCNQVNLVTILIDQLKNHGLFSCMNYHDNGNGYRIALSKKYPSSNIEYIIINFNRYNISFILTDHKEEMRFGSFKFRTPRLAPVDATITTGLSFNNDADQNIVEDLCHAFEETRVIYNESETRYHEFNKDDEVNLDEIKFVDLCTKYCGNVILSGKLTRCGYAELTARQFYNTVDLKELTTLPGIGTKSITIIKQIYVFYGLTDKNLEEEL